MAMDDVLGTNWVAPNQGSKPSELYEAAALGEQLSFSTKKIGLDRKLRNLIKAGDYPTSLALTGRRIQSYDYDRMMAL